MTLWKIIWSLPAFWKSNIMKRILILLIKFYKAAISPHLPKSCKYEPTCSQYGIEAIERFGALKGTALTIWRILRCNPFSKGGYDPVPEKRTSQEKLSEVAYGKYIWIFWKYSRLCSLGCFLLSKRFRSFNSCIYYCNQTYFVPIYCQATKIYGRHNENAKKTKGAPGKIRQ